jgi:Flp pilus assembly protein TadD
MRQKRFVRGLGSALLLSLAVPAVAQYGTSAIGDPNQVLVTSLKTLASEPKNLQALIAAGRASLELGDVQSAAGFFGRADEAYPQSPYPKIGMGAALTMGGNPAGALAQFQRAQVLGAPPSTFAIDRGLAYDLLGQQAQAQADYRTAMVGVQAEEARRRLALSQAISRDFRGAAATLDPLLRRGDAASLRTNAFVLALAGDRDGARRTIDRAMPGNGAQFEPFFKMLPVLRPAEKAAAVHLGEFPKDAAQRYAQAELVAPSPVVSISNTSPGRVDTPAKPGFREAKPSRQAKARPVETKPASKSDRRAEAPRRVREVVRPNVYSAEVRESIDPMRYVSRGPKSEPKVEPKPQPVTPAPVPSPSPDALTPLAAATEPLVPVSSPVSLDTNGEPLLDAKRTVETINLPPPPPASMPKLEIDTPPAPKPKVELASRETRRIASSKPAPSAIGVAGTHWVQLAGSASKAMMASEYKKIRGRKPELFKGQSGHVTLGKDYFRLLVGPFDDAVDAQAFVTKLDKAGIDSFRWSRTPAQIKIEKLAS